MEKNETIVLMTGATSGLGFEAAIELANRGYHLTVTARSKQKGEALIKALIDRYPAAGGSIRCIECDLSSLQSIKQAVQQFKQTHDRIDILINNAGVWHSDFTETMDKIEETLQVNLIAPFLLFRELEPLLEKSSNAKVITTSSGLHQGKINFDDIEYRNKFSGFNAYRQSKHGIILLTKMLSQQYEPLGIAFYAQHPGLVSTELGRHLGWIGTNFFKMIGISALNGAKTLIYLATTPKKELQSGAYYHKQAVASPAKSTQNMKAAAKLMDVLEGYFKSA